MIKYDKILFPTLIIISSHKIYLILIIFCFIGAFLIFGGGISFNNKEGTSNHNTVSSPIEQHKERPGNIAICISPTHFINRDQQDIDQKKCHIIGNGILLDNTGYILTAKHLFEDLDAYYFVIFPKEFSSSKFPLLNIWLHPQEDLALINISPNKTFENDTKVSFAFSQHSAITTKIKNTLVISTALLSGGTLFSTTGHITNISISGDTASLTTDLGLFPSLSGSPLFNESGDLIGINTAISHQEKNTSYSLALDEYMIDKWKEEIDNY